MIGLLLAAAIIAAVAASGMRRWRRAALWRAASVRPGASPELAIHVRSYSEMDEHLARRWCACGGYLEQAGEGTREAGARQFRVARLACQECERVEEVFFDTTHLLH